MKGIRLFVRRATPEDRSKLDSFWNTEGRRSPAGADGLIGFLLGEIAAWASIEPNPPDLRIPDFWVARNLRRKRIARAMLEELDAEARKLGSARLVIRPSDEFVEAFRRLGFAGAADGSMVRPVERVR